MACPCFYPLEKAGDMAPRVARAPLGALWSGLCHANPQAPFQPQEDVMYGACNFGYGRGECPYLPDDMDTDAVRFSDDVWVLEKDYGPHRHGRCTPGKFPSREIERQWQAWKLHAG